MTRALLAAALLLALPAAAAPTLNVRILSQVDGTKTAPDASEKFVVLGTGVTLFLDAPGELAPASAKAQRWPDCATYTTNTKRPCTVRWTKLEAADHSLSNTDPTFHWQEIAYVETPIASCDDRFTCAADVHATILEDHGGLGTMAFRVHATFGDRSASSPGFETRHRGGLLPGLARVTVRRDDSYTGRLTELFNTPYIWGSAGNDDVHQAERRIGSDCADFVTYGVRRLGHRIPYTSTWQLHRFTRELASSPAPGTDGLYRDSKGNPVIFGDRGVRPGDLLLFHGHVGALLRDEPPLGVLSRTDVMLHTSWHEPTEQSLADSGYGDGPVKVLRWKVLESR